MSAPGPVGRPLLRFYFDTLARLLIGRFGLSDTGCRLRIEHTLRIVAMLRISLRNILTDTMQSSV
jgi:hypothetical protein